MAEHSRCLCSCFVVCFVFLLSFRLSYGVLYSSADHTVLLENDTISDVIHNSQTAWVVEFYSSFCGHCHAFAPTWKKLARMAKDWRQLIHVAAIDCAEERNLATCVHYKIEGYPSVKFFNASVSISDLGETFRGEKTLLNLLHEMVKVTELQKTLGLVRADVDFIPIGNEFVTSFLEGRTSYDELALIFEVPTSYIGREVMLDMMKCPRLGVRRVLNQNKFLVDKYIPGSVKKFPYVILIHRKGTFRELSHDEKTHASFKRALEELCPGVRPLSELPEVTKAMTVYKSLHGREDKRKQEAGNSSEVYMQDLESGLSYILNIEVATKLRMGESAYRALRDFIELLSKCFPGRPSLGVLFKNLYNRLSTFRKHIYRADYLYHLHESQANLKSKSGSSVHPLPKKSNWVACLGSEPHFRGYPCSLWTLFHTLTVNCGSRHQILGQEVLGRIRDFIRYFFSCEECKKHFTEMSANLKNEVASHNGAILWLWRSHNKVNKRLAGDRSEDPKHPKIQFPSQDLCEECRLPDSNSDSDEIRWNEAVVLEFLKNHYGVDNIRIKKTAGTVSPRAGGH
ncbi:flavin-linked sulfhydryl oxidase [Desmophyllum pertusum]|uniref:Sulfhydryl oxidase n=1 Tax=Desmophyllum pertusum TaxID=174260 RepID=A0A9X0CHX5_9CNID|nr:flavin-linked sulfhydryl oxidase [Desmophyllum pertusum]